MLSLGLTSGAAQVNYSFILNMFRSVLPYNPSINKEDSKLLVPIANDMSTYDIVLILPQIKLRCLSLMSVVFRSPAPGLSKMGSGILYPLSSLICLPYTTKLLMTAAISCFGQAAACFPSLIPISGELGFEVIVGFFNTQVEYMTSLEILSDNETDERRGNSGSGISGGHSNSGNIMEPRDGPLILGVVEAILLHCGQRMDRRKRDNIEKMIAVALLCLCKGIVHPSVVNIPGQSAWSSDRRLKRSSFEPIRCNSKLQLALLRLSMMEVLSPKCDGSVGGNIALLKKAAEIVNSRKGRL